MMKVAHGEQLNGRNLNRFDEDTPIRVSFFYGKECIMEIRAPTL